MDTDAQTGRILLGKYRVEHVLGEGGMGVVVAARHIDLDQLFAIKLMRSTALADAEAVGRFLREARAAARLRSEHVARVQDVGRLEDSTPYMVMEHLSGQDLKQVLRERGPLPQHEAVLYVYQACEAVAEAHSLGIVHRDLKPANLFLTRRPNGTPCVKVLDFGISKSLDPSEKVGSDLTKTGVIMGSPHYMSPEQMGHSKGIDPRSDIWSLGVILFELLTGARPFAAEGLMEILSMIATMPAPRPSERRTDLSPSLEAIVLKCLEKPRERRFQSVRELMAALQGVMPVDQASMGMRAGSHPDLTGPLDPGAQTTKAWSGPSVTGRSRGPVGLAAAVAVAVALIGGGGAWLAIRRAPRDDAAAAIGSRGPAATAAVSAITEPTAMPAAVVMPGNTAAPAPSPEPPGEPPAPSAAPSASALEAAKPKPTREKPTEPRPKPSAAPTAPPAPKPSSTPKIPDFNE
ncbi:MAG TPA: serine/threonine-protein kinase [Polyangiaceae bacterium]|jgi:serine/threonine-protein kinase|nr:serine/threonine-protein kinase [Polyangiaceae bacterium]